jgi:glutathione S-transferase
LLAVSRARYDAAHWEEHMLKLFYGAGACSLASHITLEEIGQPYETYSVKMATGEHKSPEYLKINPRGKVPSLQIDQQFLVENVAIQNYLVRRFPEADLAPKDPLGEARWLSVNAWMSNTVHPAFGRWNRPMNFTPEESAHPAIKEAGKKAFWDCLAEIDGMLAGKTWMHGEQYTTSDPYALVFYGWGLRIAELDLKQLKNFTAHKDRMLRRPAAKKILEREQSPLLKT